MQAYYTIGLVGFLVVLAVLLVRYVNATVDKQFRSLARASTDEDFRREEIARLNRLLSGLTPLPSDVAPLAGRGSGVRTALPPVLLTVGVILLWGGGAAAERREVWLLSGFAAMGLAALIMLLTLRRRKWARTARLLLFRADLKRMDGDRSSAAEDLRELLRLTPWDDSAWSELSDDLAATGDLDGAIQAMEQASAIDPKYDEYHMLQASLAIRRGRFERARQAMEDWLSVDGVERDDPRLAVYNAALKLGEGKRDEAEAALRAILQDHNSDDWDFLDSDQALNGVRKLLPGRT